MLSMQLVKDDQPYTAVLHALRLSSGLVCLLLLIIDIAHVLTDRFVHLVSRLSACLLDTGRIPRVAAPARRALPSTRRSPPHSV